MKVTVRSALTNEILAYMHVKPEDTIEHLQDEAAYLHGLEKGRHCMKLLLPDENSGGTKNWDVKTATVAQVGWSNESDVLAVIQTVEEISVTLKHEQLSSSHCTCACCRPSVGLWEFRKMRPKVERICELSGCSSCAVDRTIYDEESWSTVRFNGVPADANVAETATQELLAKGYTPMLFNDFSKRTISLQAGPFRRMQDLDGEGPRGFVDLARLFQQIESEFDVVLAWDNYIPHPSSKRKPWKIVIAGEAKGVPAAAKVLRQLESRYWHEMTHPGQVCEEFAPPAPLWGSPCLTSWLSEQQLRHIQNNWHIRVYPPVDVLLKPTMVLVGGADGVRHAKAYVERQWQTLCQHEKLCQKLGRDAVERWGIDDRPDDFWGEEEPEDASLEAYMYKRR